MLKHSVNVLIKARDEASRKFKLIGGSALSMGSMIRRAAALAAVYFGGRAIKRFVQDSLQLFGVQEAAVKSLADALALLGKQAQLGAMKKFAAQIQQTTVYGDEMILQLMAMGSAMGKLRIADTSACWANPVSHTISRQRVIIPANICLISCSSS